MLLIPSIEVKDGKCTAGALTDPAAFAAHLIKVGAQRIQLVDLDAIAGRNSSAAAVAATIAACEGVPVQFVGGIRDEESAQRVIEIGAEFVVLDLKALHVPHLVQDLCLEFPNHVLVALDARAGRLPTEGNWSKLHQHTAIELAQQYEREGIAGVIHLDRGVDGKHPGMSVAATAELARGLSVPVIAAGGLRTEDDLAELLPFVDDGVVGALLAGALLDDVAELKALFASA